MHIFPSDSIFGHQIALDFTSSIFFLSISDGKKNEPNRSKPKHPKRTFELTAFHAFNTYRHTRKAIQIRPVVGARCTTFSACSLNFLIFFFQFTAHFRIEKFHSRPLYGLKCKCLRECVRITEYQEEIDVNECGRKKEYKCNAIKMLVSCFQMVFKFFNMQISIKYIKWCVLETRNTEIEEEILKFGAVENNSSFVFCFCLLGGGGGWREGE